jgi:tRNA uridine 5-carbamoylmethylation protein Kti12
MATNISQDDFQKTALRLPKKLHALLHEAATENGRSYNAEIISRLQQTFDAPQSLSSYDLGIAHVAKMGVMSELADIEFKISTLKMHVGSQIMSGMELSDRLDKLKSSKANTKKIQEVSQHLQENEAQLSSVQIMISKMKSREDELKEKLRALED